MLFDMVKACLHSKIFLLFRTFENFILIINSVSAFRVNCSSAWEDGGQGTHGTIIGHETAEHNGGNYRVR